MFMNPFMYTFNYLYKAEPYEIGSKFKNFFFA